MATLQGTLGAAIPHVPRFLFCGSERRRYVLAVSGSPESVATRLQALGTHRYPTIGRGVRAPIVVECAADKPLFAYWIYAGDVRAERDGAELDGTLGPPLVDWGVVLSFSIASWLTALIAIAFMISAGATGSTHILAGGSIALGWAILVQAVLRFGFRNRRRSCRSAWFEVESHLKASAETH